MAVEAGTRLGEYVIHEYLGQDDLGPLFRACGPDADSVAVKVLRGLAASRVRVRFPALARRLSGVRHPNLAAVLGFGEQYGAPYLVLQHVPGGSLADLLRTPALSRKAILRLLHGIAAGVDHAHRRRLVHGALGQCQVLMDGPDRPLVTGFGLAPLRWGRPEPVLPKAASAERDVACLAPELGNGGPPTAASDRYAYAAMAYEMLTGRTPSPATEPAPSDLGAEADEVLRRGLASEPLARWRTCTEMAAALAGAFGHGDAVTAAAATPAPAPPPAVSTLVARAPAALGSADPGSDRRLARWTLPLAAVLGVAALAAAAVLTGSAARPPAVSVELSAATVLAGDRVLVTGATLPAGQSGMVELHSQPRQLGAFGADRFGNARVEVAVPEDAAPGDHLVALCWERRCHGRAPVTVLERSRPQGTVPPAPRPIRGDPAAVGSGHSPRPPAAPPSTALPTVTPSPVSVPVASWTWSSSPDPSASPTPSQPPSPSPSPDQSRSPAPTPAPSSSPDVSRNPGDGFHRLIASIRIRCRLWR